MKHLQLFENWLNESSNWQDMVIEACSEFENKYPEGLETLISSDADGIMDNEKLQELYNEAARCIVEPDVALGTSGNIDSYYSRTENEGFNFVKQVLKEMSNGDKWIMVIDLIEELGY